MYCEYTFETVIDKDQPILVRKCSLTNEVCDKDSVEECDLYNYHTRNFPSL